MSVKSFSVFCTEFSCFLFTVAICRSLLIIVLGTYHGASVIVRSTFDWNRSSISRFDSLLNDFYEVMHIVFNIPVRFKGNLAGKVFVYIILKSHPIRCF